MQIEDARMQKGWYHGHWVHWPGYNAWNNHKGSRA